MRPGKNATLGGVLMLVVFGAASIGLYAGAKYIEPAPSVNAEETGDVTATTRVAAANLKFNLKTIVAPAGERYTITFDNQDAGVLHNLSFYTNKSASTEIYKGELFPGVKAQDESFQAPATPGSYFFRCDVHPDTMSGTFTVK